MKDVLEPVSVIQQWALRYANQITTIYLQLNLRSLNNLSN